MSGRRAIKSTNPFDDAFEDDIDDETFLRNSRKPRLDAISPTSGSTRQTFMERRREIEERTLGSTEQSLRTLRESEQVGVATAEELLRQREKLQNTDRQLDDINNTLRHSQKQINGIRSIFSNLKNYIGSRSSSGSLDAPINKPSILPMLEPSSRPQKILSPIEKTVASYDRFENHPSARVRDSTYSNPTQSKIGRQAAKPTDLNARIDANLDEMCSNISRLKMLATDMSLEIDSQNDLIGNIIDKTELADLNINKQNKDIKKLLNGK